MSERKVINKYYPPDFDPTKLGRGKRRKDNLMTVRMMLPMSVRCNTCGEYLYKGKKFNSKKETVTGEEYLGVKIFRFYMKCTNCCSEFTIKTDPQNSDYTAELNCSRNFEPWRENERLREEAKLERENEEQGDAIKALENKTLDSKIELAILEGLEEIQADNAQRIAVSPDQLIENYKKRHEEMIHRQNAIDEEELEKLVSKESGSYVKRIEESEQEKRKEPIAPAKKVEVVTKKPRIGVKIKPKNSTAPIAAPSVTKPAIVPPKVSLVDY
eukprot:TRINITY_DN4295_c0_g1_i1.p1 TRINITY_DN4295_c0_g1~~TRINITY_DN4295_c0_g1_i1.p1  ORF type:complete len:271 (+),score=67.71 TRINITY_DN4295_c0_g1_i1:69-881(+)